MSRSNSYQQQKDGLPIVPKTKSAAKYNPSSPRLHKSKRTKEANEKTPLNPNSNLQEENAKQRCTIS